MSQHKKEPLALPLTIGPSVYSLQSLDTAYGVHVISLDSVKNQGISLDNTALHCPTISIFISTS